MKHWHLSPKMHDVTSNEIICGRYVGARFVVLTVVVGIIPILRDS